MARSLFIGALAVVIAGVIAWWAATQIETRLLALDAETGRVQLVRKRPT